MSSRPKQDVKDKHTVSTKAAYSRAAKKKLDETKAKLIGVNAKIRNAIATGQIDASEQLGHARRAVDMNLATVETQVEQLRKSGEDAWVGIKDDIETAWEDLSQSIKKLVARFTDASEP